MNVATYQTEAEALLRLGQNAEEFIYVRAWFSKELLVRYVSASRAR
jgi:hypothetical protein